MRTRIITEAQRRLAFSDAAELAASTVDDCFDAAMLPGDDAEQRRQNQALGHMRGAIIEAIYAEVGVANGLDLVHPDSEATQEVPVDVLVPVEYHGVPEDALGLEDAAEAARRGRAMTGRFTP